MNIKNKYTNLVDRTVKYIEGLMESVSKRELTSVENKLVNDLYNASKIEAGGMSQWTPNILKFSKLCKKIIKNNKLKE